MTEQLKLDSNLLLCNKYLKYYKNIICNALSSSRKNVYLEKHHIIPRSMGGKNTKDNLVYLTPREHYVCHALLTKITQGKNRIKMVRAVVMMGGRVLKNKSKTYEALRIEYTKSKVGVPLTEQHREKISKSNKGIQHNPWTEEMRKRASIRLTGKKRPYLVGRIVSPETRAKIGLKSKAAWALKRVMKT